MYEDEILIIPEKTDFERDAVAVVWQEQGGKVLRLGKFWQPPELDPCKVHVYGSDTFCLVLQQKLGFNLISPPDDFLNGIDETWLKRKLRLLALSDAKSLAFPTFLKSAVPKIFKASIYQTVDDLNQECTKLPDSTMVINSEVVEFISEARAFIYNGIVLDCSVYEGSSEPKKAVSFITEFLSEVHVTKTFVLDIGEIAEKGWAIIEANASWGSGLNGCDAEKVLPAIFNATYCEV